MSEASQETDAKWLEAAVANAHKIPQHFMPTTGARDFDRAWQLCTHDGEVKPDLESQRLFAGLVCLLAEKLGRGYKFKAVNAYERWMRSSLTSEIDDVLDELLRQARATLRHNSPLPSDDVKGRPQGPTHHL